MERLLFRRQFLFSSVPAPEFAHWQFLAVGDRSLYVHPDCALTQYGEGNKQVVLLGHFLDPRQEDLGNLELLQTFMACGTPGEIAERLYPLVGRFVFLFRHNDVVYLFNDACGLKTVYYTTSDQGFFAASQPLLLQRVIPIAKEPFYDDYYESNYVKSNREHWLPCGITLFRDVDQLVPNHYVDVKANVQIRFWPIRNIQPLQLGEGVALLGPLLKKTMAAAAKRFDLAMAITAGMDSRLVLAACKDIADEIFFYTLKYRDLSNGSPDIKIPKNLLERLGHQHHILDCMGNAPETFLKIYEANTPMAHGNDWGHIAYGIQRHYPQEKMAIRGNCVEVARNYSSLYKKIKQSPSVDNIMEIQGGWKQMPYARARLELWFKEAHPLAHLGYDVIDLFYWEHRLGSWQAQSQLEWDLVQEMFTPFNNREIIDLMLGVDDEYRTDPAHFTFFHQLMKDLWPEVRQVPINPKTNGQKLKGTLKGVLTKFGLFNLVRNLGK